MNYLVKTEEGKYIVMSNVRNNWTEYIGKNSM